MKPLVPIPKDKLPDMLGKKIHLRWAKHGCVWNLLKINDDTIELITPSSRKQRTAKASDACYIRMHEPENSSMIHYYPIWDNWPSIQPSTNKIIVRWIDHANKQQQEVYTSLQLGIAQARLAELVETGYKKADIVAMVPLAYSND